MKKLLLGLIIIVMTSCCGLKTPVGPYWHRQYINNISMKHYMSSKQSTIEDNQSLRPQGDWMRYVNKKY